MPRLSLILRVTFQLYDTKALTSISENTFKNLNYAYYPYAGQQVIYCYCGVWGLQETQKFPSEV